MKARRVTILRHEPAASGLLPHFDLLVEPDGGDPEEGNRDVPTWRCPRRLDRLEVGLEFQATPIAPHRRWWLARPVGETVALEPPGGMARVVARGTLLQGDDADTTVADLLIEWVPDSGTERTADSGVARIRIERLDDARTRLERRKASTSTDRCCCHPGAGTCC